MATLRMSLANSTGKPWGDTKTEAQNTPIGNVRMSCQNGGWIPAE